MNQHPRSSPSSPPLDEFTSNQGRIQAEDQSTASVKSPTMESSISRTLRAAVAVFAVAGTTAFQPIGVPAGSRSFPPLSLRTPPTHPSPQNLLTLGPSTSHYRQSLVSITSSSAAAQQSPLFRCSNCDNQDLSSPSWRRRILRGTSSLVKRVANPLSSSNLTQGKNGDILMAGGVGSAIWSKVKKLHDPKLLLGIQVLAGDTILIGKLAGYFYSHLTLRQLWQLPLPAVL